MTVPEVAKRLSPPTPNQAQVTDLTSIAMDERWLYLAGVKDVFTCEIIGDAIGTRMAQALTGQASLRAVRRR